MPTSYQPTPTPSRAFAAIKTPPPMEPERPCGAYVVRSIADEIDEDSLAIGEGLMATAARLTRLERRLARGLDG